MERMFYWESVTCWNLKCYAWETATRDLALGLYWTTVSFVHRQLVSLTCIWYCTGEFFLHPRHMLALFTLMQVGRRGYDPVVRTSIAYGIAKLGRRAWTKASLASDARRSAVSTNRMACWSKKLDIICRGQGGRGGRYVSRKHTNPCPFRYSVHLAHVTEMILSVTSNSSNHLYKTKK